MFFVRTRALFFKGLSSSSFFFIPTFHETTKERKDRIRERYLYTARVERDDDDDDNIVIIIIIQNVTMNK